jgi:small-conductance mechanosensitive channel
MITVGWMGLVWVLARNRRRVDSALLRVTVSKTGEIKSQTLRMVGRQNLAPLLRGLTAALFWLLVGVTTFLCAEFVLRLFPHTRAFGEQLSGKFLFVLAGFGQSILQALPGLGVVLIVWMGARFTISAAKRYFNGIVQGRIQSTHFDATSAQITLRLCILIIWVAAIITAFPYIPGSHSPAFQGIGVLGGLMLSLGASSIIGQWVNGLVLVYNRTCQIGDYVKVGEFEGTLVNIGFSTSRLVTTRNEEIILPNSQLSSGSLINYTRQNATTGVIVPVTVTIGYNTPWRQVHAMLIEAARRTHRLKEQPAPTVFQTQLSDFYVEYQLRVVLQNPAERIAVVATLNANIQDVFNEYGVQIMSPHYRSDPPQPVLVPKEKWHEPPANKPI